MAGEEVWMVWPAGLVASIKAPQKLTMSQAVAACASSTPEARLDEGLLKRLAGSCL